MNTTDPTTPKLTPEVGKRHHTRGGWVTPPIRPQEHRQFTLCVGDNGNAYISWDRHGCYFSAEDAHPWDLVAVYEEPTPLGIAQHWEDRARNAEMELIAARMTAELLRKDREQDARGSNALEDEVARLQKRLAAAEKVCQVADDCAENGYHMEPHLLQSLKAWREAT